ncbi:MAG: hypothetical protein V3S63_00695 [bacterium]
MTIFVAMIVLLISGKCRAGEADVIEVKASRPDSGTYTFNVTIGHADTGWDHYADRWEVLASDGKIIATRVLLHPHVSEQPFTRSLSGITIPAGETMVTVRARDSIHKYGGKEIDVHLP